MTDHFDVLVIGSGAGGGTLTHALASTGKRILLLERGDFMPREIENWSSKSLLVNPWSISERPIRARSGKAEEGGALGVMCVDRRQRSRSGCGGSRAGQGFPNRLICTRPIGYIWSVAIFDRCTACGCTRRTPRGWATTRREANSGTTAR